MQKITKMDVQKVVVTPLSFLKQWWFSFLYLPFLSLAKAGEEITTVGDLRFPFSACLFMYVVVQIFRQREVGLLLIFSPGTTHLL